MRRFRFRLATLQRIAEAHESRQRQELARREQIRSASLARQAGAERAGAASRQRVADLIDGGAVSPTRLLSALRVMDDAGVLAGIASGELMRSTEEADQAADMLRARMVERKSLETLRARQAHRHRSELTRREERELDDMAHRRMVRRA